MGLFNPESGLVIWMLLAFGIVFAVLAKFGFPIITEMVEKRKQYIDESLVAARQANEQLIHIKEESELILAKAREEQTLILKEAVETRQRIVDEAKDNARIEGEKLLQEARLQIRKEKENALSELQNQVAQLSVAVAEKILRQNLDDAQKQNGMIERLLNEVTHTK